MSNKAKAFWWFLMTMIMSIVGGSIAAQSFFVFEVVGASGPFWVYALCSILCIVYAIECRANSAEYRRKNEG